MNTISIKIHDNKSVPLDQTGFGKMLTAMSLFSHFSHSKLISFWLNNRERKAKEEERTEKGLNKLTCNIISYKEWPLSKRVTTNDPYCIMNKNTGM